VIATVRSAHTPSLSNPSTNNLDAVALAIQSMDSQQGFLTFGLQQVVSSFKSLKQKASQPSAIVLFQKQRCVRRFLHTFTALLITTIVIKVN